MRAERKRVPADRDTKAPIVLIFCACCGHFEVALLVTAADADARIAEVIMSYRLPDNTGELEPPDRGKVNASKASWTKSQTVCYLGNGFERERNTLGKS